MATITNSGDNIYVVGEKASLDIFFATDLDTGASFYKVQFPAIDDNGAVAFVDLKKHNALEFASRICDNGWTDGEEIDLYLAEMELYDTNISHNGF